MKPGGGYVIEWWPIATGSGGLITGLEVINPWYPNFLEITFVDWDYNTCTFQYAIHIYNKARASRFLGTDDSAIQ